MRDLFLLNPDIVFLNHGSFGACPRTVFETYQHWQREMEWQPVEFLNRRARSLMDIARGKLAAYLHTSADNLIYVTNATVGVNFVARSLHLEPGDEILSTDHEYGAINKTWQFICTRTGAKLVSYPIPLPVTTHEDFVEHFWQGVTPRTKVISISHITSPTALIFPVEEICRRARESGIITVVDGAHAPGHLDLNMESIGADFYAGNCHKWLCAPKGAGFLYARPEHQQIIDPLVISHGWEPGATFVNRSEWQGTRDLAAFLSVPAAIEFQYQHDWGTVRQRSHEIAREFADLMHELTGLEPVAADTDMWFGQMITTPLPACDADEIKRRLYDEYNIEIPITGHDGTRLVRASFQGYNTEADMHRLVEALNALL